MSFSQMPLAVETNIRLAKEALLSTSERASSGLGKSYGVVYHRSKPNLSIPALPMVGAESIPWG